MLIDRIRARLVRRGDCLIWPGDNDRGYGRVRVGDRRVRDRRVRVHRIVCEDAHGPAPPDKPEAIHSCDTPSCCNPDHLRWGSHADNMRDISIRGRGRGPCEAKQGVRNGRARLTENAVRWARKLSAQGCPTAKLARCYGVGETTMRHVIAGRTWANVV